MMGRRPTNSGMRPYLSRSSGITLERRTAACLARSTGSFERVKPIVLPAAYALGDNLVQALERARHI